VLASSSPPRRVPGSPRLANRTTPKTPAASKQSTRGGLARLPRSGSCSRRGPRDLGVVSAELDSAGRRRRQHQVGPDHRRVGQARPAAAGEAGVGDGDRDPRAC